jgi:hypothetical protein
MLREERSNHERFFSGGSNKRRRNQRCFSLEAGSSPVTNVWEVIQAKYASLLLLSKSNVNHCASKNDWLYPMRAAPKAADVIDNLYDGQWLGIPGFPGCFLAPQAIEEQLLMELA